METVIITGGMGFIGSHTAKAFKAAGYKVIGVDNNFTIPAAAQFFDEFIFDDFSEQVAFCAKTHNAKAIIHIAGTSLVGPSINDPWLYYNNNVAKTNNMLDMLKDLKWNGAILFSSSAAIYGNKYSRPWEEDDLKDPISPYGWSKLMCEQIIKDHCFAHGFKGIALRYFNACGCDIDNMLGNNIADTHLVPRVIESFITNQILTINGNDFPTKDGTCIRDYLHVTDIADAHVAAVQLSKKLDNRMFEAYNLGTGIGYSNLDIVREVEKVVGSEVKIEFGPKRYGDPSELIANPNKFMKECNWKPKHSDLTSIVQTTYNWMKTLKYS
jgi:nucleoside-diphosphate-sugar epimerase|tara:strand:+ start:3974 stop:4951 length:978 start_codon:yes stop_codon:yes gene_type:complete